MVATNLSFYFIYLRVTLIILIVNICLDKGAFFSCIIIGLYAYKCIIMEHITKLMMTHTVREFLHDKINRACRDIFANLSKK